MQPLKFARIGEDPAAAPVVQAGGRAVRRKSVAHNHQQKYVSMHGLLVFCPSLCCLLALESEYVECIHDYHFDERMLFFM